MVSVHPEVIYLYPPFEEKSEATFTIKNNSDSKRAMVVVGEPDDFYERPFTLDDPDGHYIIESGEEVEVTIYLHGGTVRIPFDSEIEVYLIYCLMDSTVDFEDGFDWIQLPGVRLMTATVLLRVMPSGKSMFEGDEPEASVGGAYCNPLPLSDLTVGDRLKLFSRRRLSDDVNTCRHGCRRGQVLNQRKRSWPPLPPDPQRRRGVHRVRRGHNRLPEMVALKLIEGKFMRLRNPPLSDGRTRRSFGAELCDFVQNRVEIVSRLERLQIGGGASFSPRPQTESNLAGKGPSESSVNKGAGTSEAITDSQNALGDSKLETMENSPGPYLLGNFPTARIEEPSAPIEEPSAPKPKTRTFHASKMRKPTTD